MDAARDGGREMEPDGPAAPERPLADPRGPSPSAGAAATWGNYRAPSSRSPRSRADRPPAKGSGSGGHALRTRLGPSRRDHREESGP
eukprot:7080864-Pyramimonas_sp.AAC.1